MGKRCCQPRESTPSPVSQPLGGLQEQSFSGEMDFMAAFLDGAEVTPQSPSGFELRSISGHPPDCACKNCKAELKKATAPRESVVAAHPTDCQCKSCRPAESDASSLAPLTVGHPPDCACKTCRPPSAPELRDPTSDFLAAALENSAEEPLTINIGHPPGCACKSCKSAAQMEEPLETFEMALKRDPSSALAPVELADPVAPVAEGAYRMAGQETPAPESARREVVPLETSLAADSRDSSTSPQVGLRPEPEVVRSPELVRESSLAPVEQSPRLSELPLEAIVVRELSMSTTQGPLPSIQPQEEHTPVTKVARAMEASTREVAVVAPDPRLENTRVAERASKLAAVESRLEVLFREPPSGAPTSSAAAIRSPRPPLAARPPESSDRARSQREERGAAPRLQKVSEPAARVLSRDLAPGVPVSKIRVRRPEIAQPSSDAQVSSRLAQSLPRVRETARPPVTQALPRVSSPKPEGKMPGDVRLARTLTRPGEMRLAKRPETIERVLLAVRARFKEAVVASGPRVKAQVPVGREARAVQELPGRPLRKAPSAPSEVVRPDRRAISRASPDAPAAATTRSREVGSRAESQRTSTATEGIQRVEKTLKKLAASHGPTEGTSRVGLHRNMERRLLNRLAQLRQSLARAQREYHEFELLIQQLLVGEDSEGTAYEEIQEPLGDAASEREVVIRRRVFRKRGIALRKETTISRVSSARKGAKTPPPLSPETLVKQSVEKPSSSAVILNEKGPSDELSIESIRLDDERPSNHDAPLH